MPGAADQRATRWRHKRPHGTGPGLDQLLRSRWMRPRMRPGPQFVWWIGHCAVAEQAVAARADEEQVDVDLLLSQSILHLLGYLIERRLRQHTGDRHVIIVYRRIAEFLNGRVDGRCYLLEKLERAKGFEPSTPTLARLCSTPELRPRSRQGAVSRRLPPRLQATASHGMVRSSRLRACLARMAQHLSPRLN